MEEVVTEEGIRYFLYEGVVLGENVTIGPYAVIGKPPKVPTGTTTRKPSTQIQHTYIGDNCVIGAGATIYHGCMVGNNTLIGDGAKLRDQCIIGERCIIAMNTKIGFRTVIGDRVKIMDLCNISGNMIVEDDVFIAQGTMCANDNSMGRSNSYSDEWEDEGPTIRRGATIGQNSSLLPGVEIGEDSIVGAGSVVTKYVPPKMVVMGIPAKYVRGITEDESKF